MGAQRQGTTRFCLVRPGLMTDFETAPGSALRAALGSRQSLLRQLFRDHARPTSSSTPRPATNSGTRRSTPRRARAQGRQISATLNVRPSKTLRFEGSVAYATLNRASDGSEFANSVIPRFKIEYQPTVPLFFRIITEYQSTRQSELRDPVTGEVLLVGGVASTAYDNQGPPARFPRLVRTEPRHRGVPGLRVGSRPRRMRSTSPPCSVRTTASS